MAPAATSAIVTIKLAATRRAVEVTGKVGHYRATGPAARLARMQRKHLLPVLHVSDPHVLAADGALKVAIKVGKAEARLGVPGRLGSHRLVAAHGRLCTDTLAVVQRASIFHHLAHERRRRVPLVVDEEPHAQRHHLRRALHFTKLAVFGGVVNFLNANLKHWLSVPLVVRRYVHVALDVLELLLFGLTPVGLWDAHTAHLLLVLTTRNAHVRTREQQAHNGRRSFGARLRTLGQLPRAEELGVAAHKLARDVDAHGALGTHVVGPKCAQLDPISLAAACEGLGLALDAHDRLVEALVGELISTAIATTTTTTKPSTASNTGCTVALAGPFGVTAALVVFKQSRQSSAHASGLVAVATPAAICGSGWRSARG